MWVQVPVPAHDTNLIARTLRGNSLKWHSPLTKWCLFEYYLGSTNKMWATLHTNPDFRILMQKPTFLHCVVELKLLSFHLLLGLGQTQLQLLLLFAYSECTWLWVCVCRDVWGENILQIVYKSIDSLSFQA